MRRLVSVVGLLGRHYLALQDSYRLAGFKIYLTVSRSTVEHHAPGLGFAMLTGPAGNSSAPAAIRTKPSSFPRCENVSLRNVEFRHRGASGIASVQ
jgi:hypothetical protein